MKDLNLKPTILRVSAYLIDTFLIILLTSLLIMINPFKDNYNKYSKYYDEYEEYNLRYNDYIKELEIYYKDKEITEEEYNKLIEYTDFKDLTEKYYKNEDKEYTYEKFEKEITRTYNKKNEEYSYNLSKKGLMTNILTISITFIYFGIIQYLLKGQTIGKKITKQQVLTLDDKKPKIYIFMLRSLIVNNVFINTINVIILAFFSKSIFLKSTEIISLLLSVIEALIIYFVISRKDHRGLHDLIFKTKVVVKE